MRALPERGRVVAGAWAAGGFLGCRVRGGGSPVAEGRRYSREEARGYTEKIARTHYENFTVVSCFLPRELRQHMFVDPFTQPHRKVAGETLRPRPLSAGGPANSVADFRQAGTGDVALRHSRAHAGADSGREHAIFCDQRCRWPIPFARSSFRPLHA